jgi:hypothetical protein
MDSKEVLVNELDILIKSSLRMKRGRKLGILKFIPFLVKSKHCKKSKLIIEIKKSCNNCRLKKTCIIDDFCLKENYKHWGYDGTN